MEDLKHTGSLGGRYLQLGTGSSKEARVDEMVLNNYYVNDGVPSFSNTTDTAQSYHDHDIADYTTYGDDNAKAVTREQLASGETAYLLSQGCSGFYEVDGIEFAFDGDIWGQDIGTDEHPVLGSRKVYYDEEKGYYNQPDGDDPVEPENPFTDIDESKYYYDAVLWAVEQGITAGKTATTFAPDMVCTRGQIVTFLWRAAGEPEPQKTENPFTDVAADKFYYKAVLWAVEQGITAGKTATTFEPDAGCTRGQVVTFLWRSAGEPEPQSTENPFTDVAADKFYYKAVLWAMEEGITAGKTADTFQPDSVCIRAQIVTFLYRYMVE